MAAHYSSGTRRPEHVSSPGQRPQRRLSPAGQRRHELHGRPGLLQQQAKLSPATRRAASASNFWLTVSRARRRNARCRHPTPARSGRRQHPAHRRHAQQRQQPILAGGKPQSSARWTTPPPPVSASCSDSGTAWPVSRQEPQGLRPRQLAPTTRPRRWTAALTLRQTASKATPRPAAATRLACPHGRQHRRQRLGATDARSAIGSGSDVARITQVIILPGATAVRQRSSATVAPEPARCPTTASSTAIPSPAGHYLIETDPRFASYRQWLTSDYMLALSLDPATTQKRLGDGFYEQRLINEQVAQLTGRRFLDGYADDESQYRALMNAGVTVAREWQLRPGVALSAEQMAQLTTDMVWLVEQEVTLADGSDAEGAGAAALCPRPAKATWRPRAPCSPTTTLDLNVAGTSPTAAPGRPPAGIAHRREHQEPRRPHQRRGRPALTATRRDLDNLGGRSKPTRPRWPRPGATSPRREARRAARRRAHQSSTASPALYVNNPGGTLQLEASGDIGLLAAYLINNAPTAGFGAGTHP